MRPILYFDYASIPILLIILFTTVMKKATKGGASSRIFLAMTIMTLLGVLCDIGMDFATVIKPLNEFQINLSYFFCYVYFTLNSGVVFLYFFFLFTITRTSYRLRGFRVKFLVSLPYIAALITLYSNLLTKNMFVISPELGYQREDLIVVMYLVSFFYGITGVIYLFFCKSFLKPVNWISLISMHVLTFLVVIYQLSSFRHLVEMFAMTVSLLLVAMVVLRPEEILDSTLGLPSYKAYQDELYKMMMTKQPAIIVALRFVNASEIRSYLGDELYNNYMIMFADPINRFGRENRLSFEVYCDLSGAIYVILDDVSYDVRAVIPDLYKVIEKRTAGIEKTGAKFIPRVCIIRYPQDLEHYDEILYVGREFCGLIPYEQTFSYASDIVASRNYLVRSNIDGILSRAIKERQFEMYYQPIYSVKDGKFVSAEALIRLYDKRYGHISPGLFIPIAENRGLILSIGDIIFESVYKMLSENDFEGLGLQYIEINLSVAQCTQKDLPTKIRRIAERYGVSNDKICIEITESIYNNMGSVADENIRALSEMGFAIALDDYGTGYSNIQRILRLPLDMVKIDKSLVDGMIETNGLSVLKNTVNMMKDIDMELVVEGVESKEVLDAVVDMGCDFVQGYYFSKPLPADKFIEFLKAHNLSSSDNARTKAV